MDAKSISRNDLIYAMPLMEKLYDVIRIINPIKKELLDLNLTKIDDLDGCCYNFWKVGKICNNCTSARACNQNETFVKIGYNSDKVYMVTSIPVQLAGMPIIIELLKDITSSGVIENIENKDTNTIHSVVRRMNELAVLDCLTNVFNRRFIDERLPADIVNSSLNSESLSLIMVDIDFFKKINDTYGHLVGDEVIKTVAHTLSLRIRKDIDWIARYGGDEFIICLKNTNSNSAVNVAERMRKSIESIVINYGGKSIKVTASFGIKTLVQEQLNVEELIKEVDNKLYEAKHEGKNKVVA